MYKCSLEGVVLVYKGSTSKQQLSRFGHGRQEHLPRAPHLGHGRHYYRKPYPKRLITAGSILTGGDVLSPPAQNGAGGDSRHHRRVLLRPDGDRYDRRFVTRPGGDRRLSSPGRVTNRR